MSSSITSSKAWSVLEQDAQPGPHAGNEQSCLLQRDFGAQADGESDELKRVLLEGNPYFLGVTFFVSILHSVFDMLAFKNDIGFWLGKKNVEGLSVRTVGVYCVCQVCPFYPSALA